MEIIPNSVENLNSTFGQLNSEDVQLRKAFRFRDKLFLFKNLAMSQSENLSFRPSYDFDGQVKIPLARSCVENPYGGEGIDASAFDDSAQVHVFVWAMRDGEKPWAIGEARYALRRIKASFQQTRAQLKSDR